MNPYQSPSIVDVGSDSSKPSHRNWYCLGVWVTGFCLLSILTALDGLLSSRLPGELLYVGFLVSIVVCGVAVLACSGRIGAKLALLAGTAILLVVQLLALGAIAIAVGGLEGVQ